jgi:hypothetical protein
MTVVGLARVLLALRQALDLESSPSGRRRPW